MIGDISRAERIYIVCGYTDMRKAIDGLAAIVYPPNKTPPITKVNPRVAARGLMLHNTLQIFCTESFQGRSSFRISGLVRNSILGRTVRRSSKYLNTSRLFAFAVSAIL